MIVARGRIRVDAKRAIRKLRDHLLVDLQLYACEIVRVAVATGATWLDITWDTDDVRFTFDGRALPAADVVRAREDVLSPNLHAENGAALRVLGIGVSAALGLGPHFVDVLTADASGTTRVRFESKHIDEDADAEEPTASAAKPVPALAGKPGMQVHVRKKIGWADVSRALHGELPREVSLVLDATRSTPLTITLEGKPPARSPEPVVLMRVDLDDPSLRRGSLELLAATTGVGYTHFLDLGVLLAETSALGLRETADLPLRVIVDSARLPTNASRSQVQTESDVVERVRGRMRSTLDLAIQELSRVIETRNVPQAPRAGVTFVERRLPILEQLLGELAASVAIAMRGDGKSEVSATEQTLLALPLLRDAMGRPLALMNVRGGTLAAPLHIHHGPEPLPTELASWMQHAVWQHGQKAERALRGLVTEDAAPRVALAKVAAERRRRALAHEPSSPRLGRSTEYVVLRTLDTEGGRFAGLVGEVGVLRGRGRAASTVRMLVEGRLIEEMPLPGAALPVDIVISWPGHIFPRFAYDGVERNTAFENATLFALYTAAFALLDEKTSDPELTRQAVTALVFTNRALLQGPLDARMLRALESAAAWPLTDGTLSTTAMLETYIRRTNALCTGPAGAGAAHDGRPVLVAEHVREVLAVLSRDAMTTVAYHRVLTGGEPAVLRALASHARDAWLTVPIARPNALGFVGVGAARERTLHGGALLRDREVTFHFGPVLIVYEDRTAVPRPDFQGVRYSALDDLRTHDEEQQLLDAVLAFATRGEPLPVVGRDYLLAAREKLGARRARDPKLDRLYEEVSQACARLPKVPPPLPKRVVPGRVLVVENRPPPRAVRQPAAPPVAEPPLGLAGELHRMLRAIDITSRHVVRVEESPHGRPIRYARATRIVSVNTAHELVLALDGDPQKVLLLCLAAISEINRALAQVTDAEERRVLMALLR